MTIYPLAKVRNPYYLSRESRFLYNHTYHLLVLEVHSSATECLYINCFCTFSLDSHQLSIPLPYKSTSCIINNNQLNNAFVSN